MKQQVLNVISEAFEVWHSKPPSGHKKLVERPRERLGFEETHAP